MIWGVDRRIGWSAERRYANRLDELEIQGKSEALFIRILVAESTRCDEWEYKLGVIQIEAFGNAQSSEERRWKIQV